MKLKINIPLFKKWIKVLRSGKFKQGHQFLRRDDEYCCLGVFCEISKEATWKAVPDNTSFSYDCANKTLPASVRNLSKIPWLLEMELVKMNDNGKTFKQIANRIEKFLKNKEYQKFRED